MSYGLLARREEVSTNLRNEKWKNLMDGTVLRDLADGELRIIAKLVEVS